MGNKTFVMDADKCTGCRLCVVSCKDEHVDSEYAPWSRPQPESGQFWIDVKPIERGRLPRLRVSFLPVHCQNCADAPCIEACPDDAIKTRDDGIVWIDPVACTGCGECGPACPYDVIFMNEDLDIAQKCTGCAHRIDEGLLPRCAEVCPHDAILFTEVDAVEDDGRPLETFHPEYGAEPRVLWKGLPRPWIAGTVIDGAADEVIEGVEITSTGLSDEGTVTGHSDAFGDFWLRNMSENRKYRVEIRKDGYEEFVTTVTTDGDRDLGTVALTRKA